MQWIYVIHVKSNKCTDFKVCSIDVGVDAHGDPTTIVLKS